MPAFPSASVCLPVWSSHAFGLSASNAPHTPPPPQCPNVQTTADEVERLAAANRRLQQQQEHMHQQLLAMQTQTATSMQAQTLASTDFSRPNMEMEMRRELQTFQQQVSSPANPPPLFSQNKNSRRRRNKGGEGRGATVAVGLFASAVSPHCRCIFVFKWFLSAVGRTAESATPPAKALAQCELNNCAEP